MWPFASQPGAASPASRRNPADWGPHPTTSTRADTVLGPVRDQHTHTITQPIRTQWNTNRNNRNTQCALKQQTDILRASSVWPLLFSSLGAAAVQSTYTGLDGAPLGVVALWPRRGVVGRPVERVQGRGGSRASLATLSYATWIQRLVRVAADRLLGTTDHDGRAGREGR